MLENKVIIYDDSCPMCKLYTYWFVAWGFLEGQNRIGFATAPTSITDNIDLVRGRHEIPLYDLSTQETIYGIKALTFLLGSRWKWLKPAFESKLFGFVFYPLYEIITYNRRVIAGCKTCCGFDCAPDFNRFYRSVYLGLAGGVVLALVTALLFYASSIATWAGVSISVLFLLGVGVGGVKRYHSSALAAWNFAGNFMTALMMTAIVASPLLLLSKDQVVTGWLIYGLALMLLVEELYRRSSFSTHVLNPT